MQTIITAIENLIEEHNGTLIIAIDGQCASGKSTFAQTLSEHFNGLCFHMDDFYLPFELRTPERMKLPGGNVHYERIIEEILEPAHTGREIKHRTYCSSTHSFSENTIYKPTGIVVLEGTYALHPQLLPFYDYKIFFKQERVKQLERIETRNGIKKRYEFELRWIPLENDYFTAFSPENSADFIMDTTSLF